MQQSRERKQRKGERERDRRNKEKEKGKERERREKNLIQGLHIAALKEKLLRLLVRAEIRPSQEETTYISGQHKHGCFISCI